MAGVRFLLAGAMLYGWARVRGAPIPCACHWRSASVEIIGALLLLGGNGDVTGASERIVVGLAALLRRHHANLDHRAGLAGPGGTRPDGRAIAGLLLGSVGICCSSAGEPRRR